MAKLYIIPVNDLPFEINLSTEPSFEFIREKMGLPADTTLAHQQITWRRKAAHLFCDEDGLSRKLPLNLQAYTFVARRTLVGPVAIWTGRMS